MKKKIEFLIIFLLILANAYLWQAVFNLDGNLHIVFFDVGQGDSIFVETAQGHQILIDGGPSEKILSKKLTKQIPFWDKDLDLIILTHPEYDHLEGLLYVLKRYKVKNILWTGILRDTNVFREWKKALVEEKEKDKANVVIARAGEKIKAGNVRISILYPFQSLKDKNYKDSNDTSVVSRLVFGKDSFLFTGDATKDTESKLLAGKVSVNSDVLKIGHHGSKTSTSEKFLEEVSPEIAAISVSGKNVKGPDCSNKKRNRYGHPSCEVLQRLKNFGIKVLRTDLGGDIKIFSDGENLNLKSQISKIKNEN